MPLELINLGNAPSGVTGDTIRSGNTKMNANMKLLNDWGFGGDMTRAVSDCNLATQPGWWNVAGGGASNLPPGVPYPAIFVGRFPGGALVQIAIDITTGVQATRGLYNGNWSKWQTDTDEKWLNGFTITTAEANTAATGVRYVVGLALPPGARSGYLFTARFDDKYAQQTFRSDSSNTAWVRTQANGTWTGWYMEFNAFNAVGSMAQGAIAETGTSGGTWYSRYIDGMQICSGGNRTEVMVSGGGTTVLTIPLPVPFSASFSMSAWAIIDAPQMNWESTILGTGNAMTSSTIAFLVRNNAAPNGSTAAQSVLLRWFAVGRWK